MRKSLLCTAVAALMLTGFRAYADEGMWLPALISQRIDDMQAKGFKLDAEDIYSVNQACLKDAVVLFGSGCTGELISGEGLLITNHHCGYGQIQKHSSIEHDYLKDGFWAMDRSKELPNPGLSVRFLVRMEDVTAKILQGYKPQMTESQRDSVVSANSAALRESAESEGVGMKASVEALFFGNQYYLFVYKEYTDVRLVGAPPSSIGKFGGDTDNWMWPRHTGDFSLFRIYAGPDNEPADYSEENVPYQPKKFLKILLAGAQEGDFTMIYGYPGYTKEYITAEEVRYISEVSDPMRIELRTKRLDIQKKYMDADRGIKIRYSSKNASVANGWKKWQGEVKGIHRLGTIRDKKEYEAAFEKWAEDTEYEGVTFRIDSILALLNPYQYAIELYSETAGAVELPGLTTEKLKDYWLPIDHESFNSIMNGFAEKVPAQLAPGFFRDSVAKYGSIEAWGDAIFAEAKTDADGNVISDVPTPLAKAFKGGFIDWAYQFLFPVRARYNAELQPLKRLYMRGQMEFAEATGVRDMKDFYPDANLTLRVAYGKVGGYSPADGIEYLPVSTLDGIIEKDNPEIFDYNIPQRLRDIYAAKDYGRWAVDGKVSACFLATNHTTGGNSGSPVLNADGNLVGVNFDRVWEGTMSDIAFDPDYCRNISLDIRYALFIIDRIGNASWLFDEMEFVE